jgi:hypothetical protein
LIAGVLSGWLELSLFTLDAISFKQNSSVQPFGYLFFIVHFCMLSVRIISIRQYIFILPNRTEATSRLERPLVALDK